MCGILGVIGREATREEIEASVDVMEHRGPDQAGVYQEGIVNLAHRRLSIIDLSENAQQPMSNEDGTVLIVFNGMIYDHHLLREQLISNHSFRSKSDTEVLIHGYEEWGFTGLLERIDGMFAFAIWDKNKDRVFIARDRLGKKPLFYEQASGKLLFASTLNALTKVSQSPRVLSKNAIHEYLIRTHIPAPLTIYEGVNKLEPGHFLTYSIGSSELKNESYWQPDLSQKQNISEQDAIENTRELLVQAVKRRLDADVPVGAFLSGGIDSSLICSIMSQELGFDFNTYTIRFPIDKYNEADAACAISKELGTNHHETTFEMNFTDDIERIICHFGEPFGDHSMLPTFLVSATAKRDVSVVLTGDGGDESFAGYYTSYALKVAKNFNWLLRPGLIRSIIEKTPITRVKKARWLLELNSAKGGRYVYDGIGNKGYRLELESIIKSTRSAQEVLDEVDASNDAVWASQPLKWEDRGLLVDMMTTLPNNMLTKVDVATMAYGVEARSPFLDKNLMDFAATLPVDLKLKGFNTKYILRKLASQYLPKSVTERPKQGFSLPVDEWISENKEFVINSINSAKSFLDEFIHYDYVAGLLEDHYVQRKKQGRRIWLLFVLSIWCMKNLRS